MNNYLKETKLLDFNNGEIQDLVKSRNWKNLLQKDKILKIYNFVRDEMKFGFNRQDDLKSSEILKDGYGQCNTKSILFMSLLRAVGVSCRIHGFTVKSDLQKGALDGIWYKLRPKELIHTWVEILYDSKWLNIEGFILDIDFLTSVQNKYNDCSGSFCGYGIATKDFKKPSVYWEENDTYIQKEGIVRDFGIFDNPDEFFNKYKQDLNFFKRFIYRNITRHSMNRNIEKTRRVYRKEI